MQPNLPSTSPIMGDKKKVSSDREKHTYNDNRCIEDQGKHEEEDVLGQTYRNHVIKD